VTFFAKLVGAQESHGAPPGYYLVAFRHRPGALHPAGDRRRAWAWRQRRQKAVRFCLAWLLPSWLVFELVRPSCRTTCCRCCRRWRCSPPPRWPRRRPRRAGAAGDRGRHGDRARVAVAAVAAALAARGPARRGGAGRRGGDARAALAGYLMLWRGRNATALAALAAAALLQSLTVFRARPAAPAVAVDRAAPRPAAGRRAGLPGRGAGDRRLRRAEPGVRPRTATRLVDVDGAASALLTGPACSRAAVAEDAAAGFQAALARGGRRAEKLAGIDGFQHLEGQGR